MWGGAKMGKSWGRRGAEEVGQRWDRGEAEVGQSLDRCGVEVVHMCGRDEIKEDV